MIYANEPMTRPMIVCDQKGVKQCVRVSMIRYVYFAGRNLPVAGERRQFSNRHWLSGSL